jgi:hypothetical protein
MSDDALQAGDEATLQELHRVEYGSKQGATQDLNQLLGSFRQPSRHIRVTFEEGFLWWATVRDGVTVSPENEMVRLTIALPVSVKADLDRYAELYGAAYGEAVDAAALVPHMLAAFTEHDRAFRRARPKSPQSIARSDRTGPIGTAMLKCLIWSDVSSLR